MNENKQNQRDFTENPHDEQARQTAADKPSLNGSSQSAFSENPQENSSENRTIETFEPNEQFDAKFNSAPNSGSFQEDEQKANHTDEQNREYQFTGGKRQRPVRNLPPLTPARRISEGALMTALTVVLGLAAFYAPILDMIILMLCPIPIMFLIKRHNIGTGVLAFLAAAALLSLFLGINHGAFIVLTIGAVGIWYGVALRKNLKPLLTVAVGTALSAVSVAVTMLTSLWVMGISVSGVDTYITQYVDQTVQVLQSTGVFDTLAGGISAEDYKQMMVSMLTRLIPGMLIIIAMVQALFCYIISGAVFRRLGITVQTMPKFRDWHMGWPALWGLIIALLAYLGYHYLHYDILKEIALNILYIYYPIMMATGISLVVWFYKNTRSLFMPIVLIVGAFLFPSGIIISIMMFSLFDTVVDFRGSFRRNAKNRPKNPMG